MGVGVELRALLWSERDWCDALRREAAALRAQPIVASHAPRALALAAALEEVEPDRTRAIEMYLVAWKASRQPAALGRARALCNEVGDLPSAVKIARLEYQHTGDPRLLHDEGVALLDLDQADEAVKPLLEASRALPGDPAVAAALAAARREWPDPRAELERLINAARGLGPTPAAAAAYLQAARVVRSQRGEPQLHGRLLAAAFEASPRDDYAYGRLEAALIEKGGSEELLALYRRRLEVSSAVAGRWEDLRRAGTRLVTRNVQPGLGLRLLDRGLREAYGHGVDPLPGQLASLELLHRHAVASRSLPRFLGLLADGLAVARDDSVKVWLAARAVDITWTALQQAEIARTYAGRLAELAPQHPALVEYLATGGLPEMEAIPQIAGDEDGLVYLDSGSWKVPVEVGTMERQVLPPKEPTAPKVNLGQALPAREATAPKVNLGQALPAREATAPTLNLGQPLPAREATAPTPNLGQALPSPGGFAATPSRVGSNPLAAAPTSARPEAAEPTSYAPPPARLGTQPGAPAAPDLDLDVPIDLGLEEEPAAAAPSPGASKTIAGFPPTIPAARPAAAPPPTPAARPPATPPPVPAAASSNPGLGPAGGAKTTTLGRVAVVARPAHMVKPGSEIPTGALEALRAAATAQPGLIPAPTLPPEARERAPRLEMPIDVSLTVLGSGRPPVPAVTRDLSASGLFAVTSATLERGDSLDVALALPTDDPLVLATFTARARVVRCVPGGYGLVFVEPPAALIQAIGELIASHHRNFDDRAR